MCILEYAQLVLPDYSYGNSSFPQTIYPNAYQFTRRILVNWVVAKD